MIAGIFLAAGSSARFGADKLFCKIRGKPLVYHGLLACTRSRLPRVYVVVASQSPELVNVLAQLSSEQTEFTVVPNQHPERGQMSSVKVGLRSLDPKYEGAMVILGDMPYVTPEIIDALISAFASSKGIILPECDGQLYHPRVIPKRLFPDFLRLGDDKRGGEVFERFGNDVVTVSIGDKSNYIDIDTAGDLESLP
ncbi:MAG: nucleotidyltransferase family protein [Candidatus Krumholzibacteria bacterium]|nr:nucleotidyltransferase family protein [Candidatus Krumholzibacteria bacterium]